MTIRSSPMATANSQPSTGASISRQSARAMLTDAADTRSNRMGHLGPPTTAAEIAAAPTMSSRAPSRDSNGTVGKLAIGMLVGGCTHRAAMVALGGAGARVASGG